MYESIQNMVLGKIQNRKGNAYNGIYFPFFFCVEGKEHNTSGVQTFFQLLESATKSVSKSLDQCLSQMTVDTDTGMLKRLFDDQIDYKIMKHFRR